MNNCLEKFRNLLVVLLFLLLLPTSEPEILALGMHFCEKCLQGHSFNWLYWWEKQSSFLDCSSWRKAKFLMNLQTFVLPSFFSGYTFGIHRDCKHRDAFFIFWVRWMISIHLNLMGIFFMVTVKWKFITSHS